MNVNTIRTITIKGEGQQSLDSLAGSLNKVAAAEGAVASVTDIQTKRTLSAEAAYKRQTLAVVEGARAQDQYARAVRVADQALNQGRISASEHAQRLTVLQQKYLETGKAAGQLTTATQGMNKAFGVATNALAAFGVALSAAALINYAKQIFKTTADLQEQADQILGAGGNVEALQALRGTFMQNGIEQEAGDKILQRLTRTLGEAADGSKKAQDAFAKLGLGSKQLAGSSADAALPLVAARLLEIENASARAKIETDLFGKSGQQLESALGALASGSMVDLIARGKELGIVIDRDMIKKADDAADKMALAWMKLSVSLAPIIIQWVDGFTKFAEKIGGTTSNLEKLIRAVQVLGAIWAGAKAGALFGPWGGLAGAVIGGGAAYAATGDRSAVDQKAIANYQTRLAGNGLSPSERKDLELRIARLQAGQQTLQLYSGPFNLPAAANSNTATSWNSTTEAQAATKRAAADAKKIEDSRKILALDKEIAQAADDAAKSALKTNEIQQEYIRHQEEVASNTEQYLADLQTEVQFAGMSREEREIQAAIMEGIRVSEGKITEAQRQQITGLVRARQESEKWRDVVRGISGGFERFFEDVLNNGVLNFGRLWDTIKQQFVQMLAQMAAQALINPIIVPVVEGIGSFFGLGSGASAAASAGSAASSAAGGLGFLGGIGSKGFGGLFDHTATDALGYNYTMPGSLGIGSLGSVLGYAGLAATAFSLLSPVIGGLTGSSNQGAISNFTNGGLGNTLFKAGGGNNGQLATTASSQINAAIKTLQDAGVNVSLGNITGLSIGSDKSYVYDASGGKQKLAGGDVEGVVKAILDRILPSASGTTDIAQGVLGQFGGLNSGNLTQVLAELQSAQEIKNQAEEAAAALKAEAEAFGPAIAASLKAIQDPVGAQYDAILAAQKARYDQAVSLGVDVSQLTALNDAEINKFYSGLTLSQLQGIPGASGTTAYSAAERAAQLEQAKADEAASAQALAIAHEQLAASYDAERSTLDQTISKYQTLADSLRSYQSSLSISGASNPLQRYGATRGAFASTAALAQGGDINAMGDLQRVGSEFLDASRSASQNSLQYSRDLAMVRAAVGGSISSAQGQADIASRQLSALTASVEGLININQSVISVRDAINTLTAAMAASAKDTKKVADLLTRVTRDGDSLVTEAA